MSFSQAEKRNLLEKWKEDKYLENKNKKIDYPNKNSNVNIYLYQCLYVLVKKNPKYINAYCPYCLKTENNKSVIEPEDTEFDYQFSRDFYIDELLKDLENNNTIKNEYDILKRYSKDCKHFFHTKCIEEISKKYTHYCHYCDHHINVENITLFQGFKDYEELGTYVAVFHNVNFKTKQSYEFERRVLGILRNFIRTDAKVNQISKGRLLKKAIETGVKFRSLGNKYDYGYDYYFCVNIDDIDIYSDEKYIEEEKKAIAFYEEKMRKKKKEKKEEENC